LKGLGECREPFAWPVRDLARDDISGASVYKVAYLFVDTSPMWMEKFLAAVKRHRVLIIDATRAREFDLNDPADEAAFHALDQLRPR
jgi:hypothetical protein